MIYSRLQSIWPTIRLVIQLIMSRYTKALDNIKALRKERVADLKAEKEHLEGLRREKAHADKLRNTLSDLQATISSKEIEYEETTKAYNEMAIANAKFYEYSIKFREKYKDIELLTENIKLFENQMNEAKMNLQAELPGNIAAFPFRSRSLRTIYRERRGAENAARQPRRND